MFSAIVVDVLVVDELVVGGTVEDVVVVVLVVEVEDVDDVEGGGFTGG